jgi:transcriptional regulator with XRE-family HTH domain
MLSLTEEADIRLPAPGRIRQARKAAGMTQAQLCAAAEIGISTLEKLERGGDRGAGPRVRGSLASVLGVAEDDLFEPPTVVGVSKAAELTGHCRRTIRVAIDSRDLHTLPSPPLPALEDLPEWLTVREVQELTGESQPTVNREMTLEGARQPDGSWRLPREAALEYARDRQARDRIDLEELQRWAEEHDRQLAARATPRLRCVFCGDEFTRRRSAVGDIVRSYCTLDHYFEHRRDEAMARAAAMPRGGCGSPTCPDPRCMVRSGRCHRDECDRPAAVATETRERDRHVVGEPTLYCTPKCARLDRNRGDAYRESKRELKAARYVLTTRNAQKMLGRSKPVICKWAKALGIGRHLRGDDGQPGPLRFRPEDIRTLREELRRWDHLTSREPDPGEWGRVAPVLAELHGERPGRKRKYSDEQEALVRRLRLEGLSYGRIVMKTEIPLQQVRRILKKSANA